jgi:uncharacterized membrane protein YvbJ
MNQEQARRSPEQVSLAGPGNCPSCGDALNEGDLFCESCGHELDRPTTAGIAPVPEEEPRGRFAWLWPIVAVVWIVLAVLALVWVYGRALVLE